MYLHGLGDPKASFTKEQMHAGKHTEYMKALLEEFVANHPSTADSDGVTNSNAIILNKSDAITAQNQEPSEVRFDSMSGVSNADNDTPRSPRKASISIVTSDSSTIRSGDLPSTNNHDQPSFPSSSSCISYDYSKGLFYSQRQTGANCQNSNGGSSSLSGSNANMNAFADIDFDPIRESQVGLAELMASEQPPPPQISLATQTFSPSMSMIFTPPPGFENSPAAPPEGLASLMAAISHTRSVDPVSFASTLLSQAQQQHQQLHWNAFNRTTNLDILTQFLRQTMQIDGAQPSQSVQTAVSTESLSGGGTGDFKRYAPSSTSATASTLNVRLVTSFL